MGDGMARGEAVGGGVEGGGGGVAVVAVAVCRCGCGEDEVDGMWHECRRCATRCQVRLASEVGAGVWLGVLRVVDDLDVRGELSAALGVVWQTGQGSVLAIVLEAMFLVFVLGAPLGIMLSVALKAILEFVLAVVSQIFPAFMV